MAYKFLFGQFEITYYDLSVGQFEMAYYFQCCQVQMAFYSQIGQPNWLTTFNLASLSLTLTLCGIVVSEDQSPNGRQKLFEHPMNKSVWTLCNISWTPWTCTMIHKFCQADAILALLCNDEDEKHRIVLLAMMLNFDKLLTR